MNDSRKNKTLEKLEKIRQRMREEKVDAYIILSDDFHTSEYVGEYFKCREYVSGFTGSAGTVLILKEEAGLWTDGRYFLQAEQELSGSSITLYRMEEEGVPTIEEYLQHNLPKQACLGVDGRTISVNSYRKLKKKLCGKQITFRLDCDFAGDIWQDRPKMPCEPAWELEVCYAGKPRAGKLEEIRKKLLEQKADCTVISSLDDIAWTLNVRGGDVACTPVVLSFLVISNSQAVWFVQHEAVSKKLEDKLKADGVSLRDYYEIYSYLAEELESSVLYLDPARVNMLLYQNALNQNKDKKRQIKEGKNLMLLPKAVKNPIELNNMRLAHIKDAAACTKFIYWIKTHVKSEQITELSAEKKLREFRQKQEHFIEPSFESIVGYAEHSAIIHYKPAPDTNLPLKPENLLLVDSGGQYLEGTTDITRTIALGAVSDEQKHYYTLVLKGHLRLAAAKYKYGCAGINLDYLAREPLMQEGLDYSHGTGHGVGCLLSVHEPPNAIRSKATENREECTRLEAGMVVSNEPGLYMAGKYGIRIENLIICRNLEKNAYGQFMGFETLTLVPYERDAIAAEELTERERELLNQYHERVFQTVSPYLDDEERAWLKEVTAAV